MAFEMITGLYLLSFLAALILLYMIRAKPKDASIPSLLFFTSQQAKKYHSLLQKLLVRALFFLQAGAIILAAFSAANPTITLPPATVSLAGASAVVLVSNVSASKARSLITNIQPTGPSTRLDSGILLANDLMG